ncbi:Respiratory supercomplex factor 1 [Emericellopsis cladophorae]|uniref:Respiratory supercomplex factor 1 n=1 Tax=Emericellopsis cladophorae TaxID=2686198 RepID=A0A9P9Y363_9HYPO|nr:Respiratory supercomplex factor 1 [Emericellopsis cladophorae]KAI6782288.1 Respiratory supercomplex factor 1 [Emericellopsis cladophorae]
MADRPPELGPGQMPSSFDSNPDFHQEKALRKVVRKVKEEPLVPLGIGLTVFAFVNAYRALRKGDSHQANRMFRARVMAQGFTVVAMVAGSMYYSKDREKTAELRKLKEQRDAEEKRQKWIRELEARDEEEQKLKRRLQRKAAEGAAQAENKVQEELAAGEHGNTEGTGGILGKMGLWQQGEQAAAEAKAKAEEVTDNVEKEIKERNPKSSLGTLGEMMSSQNKDGPKK